MATKINRSVNFFDQRWWAMRFSGFASVFRSEKRSGKKMNMLLGRAVKEDRLDLARFIISRGGKVKYELSPGKTLLHFAVANNNIEMAKLLIKHGADVNLCNDKDNMWLWYNIFNVS